jgi:dihydrofolate reductase
MRKIVFQMMATLNGRLDDPAAWVHNVSDDQYRRIDELYATYDTVLVGRTTYEEMAAYWPDAVSEGTETNRRMAQRMNDYRKLFFSRSGTHKFTAWNNVEQVVTANDEALAEYLTGLKSQPDGDIHLSGGASFAQTVIGLGLVDAFHFFVYPTVSQGQSWFTRLPHKQDLELRSTERYGNGVVRLDYVPREPARATRPGRFTELLS